MNKPIQKALALLLTSALCLSLCVPAGAVEARPEEEAPLFTAEAEAHTPALEEADREAAPAAPAGTIPVYAEAVDNDVLNTGPERRRMDGEAIPQTLYRDTDTVRVSIFFEDAPVLEAGFSLYGIAADTQAAAYRSTLQARQDAVIRRISRSVLDGADLDVMWNLTLAANLVSANVAYGQIEAIQAIPGVQDVVLETRYETAQVRSDPADPNMATSQAITGSAGAWAAGYTGAGSRVAIIDTGTDTDHQSFDAAAFDYALSQNVKDGEDLQTYLDSLDLLDTQEIVTLLPKLNIAKYVDRTQAGRLFLTRKLAFGYNYVDRNFDVTHDSDTQGSHGSHVAGIAAANRFIPEGGGYVPALDSVKMQGVAPDAQILTMKVFGKGGGAYDSDYMAAIEDAVVLGCDSINLSLGSGSPGMTSSGKYQQIFDNLERSGAVVTISAGNSGHWAENAVNGVPYLYSDDVSFQMTGSPSSYTNSLGVASIDNDGKTGEYLTVGGTPIFFSESSGYSNAPISSLAKGGSAAYDFILFENTAVDAAGNDLLEEYAALTRDKVVFVYRGASSFYQKHDAVEAAGGIACIVVNNQAGVINMNLEGSSAVIPCVSITQADGETVKAAAVPVTGDDGSVLYYTGKITVQDSVGVLEGDGSRVMSSFSSWGVPGSLQMKPEITAPGGNIYSIDGVTPGGQGYENMSGTSMAAPQAAGMAAVLAQYIRETDLCAKTGLSARQLIQSLLMSTAVPVLDSDSGSYYSVLQQGAGSANVSDAISASSYITVDAGATSGAADGKVKVELGDDPRRTGTYEAAFTVHNFSDRDISFEFSADVFTQDVFSYQGSLYLDTWTTPLGATAVFDLGIGSGLPLLHDVNGDGTLDAKDVLAILDTAVGKDVTPFDSAAADLDGDGAVTSYDAYLLMSGYQMDGSYAVIPAGTAQQVKVTVRLDAADMAALDSLCPNGAYVQAFLSARELGSPEGVLGVRHTIPVLGYYGRWSDPSMYDVGSLTKFWYEEETRYPYLPDSSDDPQPQLFSNFLSIRYGGAEEYYYYGNMIWDETYLPERNAFNSDTDILSKYYFSPIRNAGGAICQITDAQSGTVYLREELGDITSAYYYSNGGSWQNTRRSLDLSWQGTDRDGNKLQEDTQVDISLILAPEYYASADGTYDWDALTGENGTLGQGAYLTTRVAIDNTAPALEGEIVYDPGENAFIFKAKDNRYLAEAALYQRGQESPADSVLPGQTPEQKGQAVEIRLDASALEDQAEIYIQLTDYARNQTTYKLILGGSADPVKPTKIAVSPETLTLVKGTRSAALSVSYEPWLAQEGVTWKSSNNDIATVDANGIVTAVAEGTADITATSTVDPTVSGTCQVTVKTYNVTLTGALQDTEGKLQTFTWDMAKADTWTKGFDLESDLSAAALGGHENTAYYMNSDGYLYKADLSNGTILDTSANATAVGVALWDLTYVPDSDTLAGVYGPYFLITAPAMGNSFGSYLNLGSYLSAYANASSLTAVTYMGKLAANDQSLWDTFYCMTDSGKIWIMALDLTTGDVKVGVAPTNLDLSWPTANNSCYASMALGGDGNLYLSYFTGDTNEIYVLEYNDADERYEAFLLGDVGQDVWPCALLSVRDNATGQIADISSIDHIQALLEIQLTAEIPVTPEEDPGQAPVEGEEPQPGEDEAPQPGEGEETQPGEGEAPQPGEDEEPQPGEDEEPQPGEDEAPQPGEGEDPQPDEDENPQPGEDEDPQPGEDEAPQPGEDEEPQPGEDEEPQPGEDEEPQPGEGEEPQPGEDEAPQPGEDEEPQPGEDEEPQPGEDEAPRPGEDGSAAPVGTLNAVQVKGTTSANAAAAINGKSGAALKAVVLDITAQGVGNGKLSIAYDSSVLTLVSPQIADGVLSSSRLAVNGTTNTLFLAYSAETILNGTVGRLTFTYDPDKGPGTTQVAVATLEDGAVVQPTNTDYLIFTLHSIPSSSGGGGGGSSTPAQPATPEQPPAEQAPAFQDVSQAHPFFADIQFVSRQGLMQGVAPETFLPGGTATRAQLAAILYRLAGQPAVSAAASYPDVPQGQYYSDAVAWAAANGIITGFSDGAFRPGQPITREQLVTMLYRYAKHQGQDTGAGENTNILSFDDVSQAAEQAIPALQWALGSGVLNGTSATTIDPKGTATRGQIAAILHRYCQWMEQTASPA